MATTRVDYTEQAVQAAYSVLLELSHLLGEYRDDTVLVGGWVPFLLMPEAACTHVGSMDIDLALDHRKLNDAGYRTIQGLLLERGYRQGKQPFIFQRVVSIQGVEHIVQVDLLAGEYGGTGRKRRTQQAQDVRARKARGCDLAFDLVTAVAIAGVLPDGGRDRATIRVASIVPFIIMKAMALADRLKEKDAWDIYYCLTHYPGGVDAIIKAFLPYTGHGLVREGLAKMADAYASPEHVGPVSVVNFEGSTEDRDFILRDAYERVQYLLNALRPASGQQEPTISGQKE